MKTANEVKQIVHMKLLNIRNLFTLVTSERFIEAFEQATIDQRNTISSHIDFCDCEKLSNLLKDILKTSYDSWSMRDLRQLGQRLGVRGYNNLSKAILLSEIKQREAINEQSNMPIKGDGAEVRENQSEDTQQNI